MSLSTAARCPRTCSSARCFSDPVPSTSPASTPTIAPSAVLPTGFKVENNDLAAPVSGNLALQVKNFSALAAPCNWFGTADSASIAKLVSTGVTYAPYLVDGTDTSPAPGFQPVSGSCKGL